MYAAPSSDTKSRSPRVVSNLRIPTRGEPPGTKYSQMLMPTSSMKIARKNNAVGSVHAIQEKFMSGPPLSDAAEREALGDVIAYEVDDERAGDDGQHTGSRQHTPIHPCSGDGARHDRRNRLCGSRRQRAGPQQFHPREHEAKEGGDTDP